MPYYNFPLYFSHSPKLGLDEFVDQKTCASKHHLDQATKKKIPDSVSWLMTIEKPLEENTRRIPCSGHSSWSWGEESLFLHGLPPRNIRGKSIMKLHSISKPCNRAWELIHNQIKNLKHEMMLFASKPRPIWCIQMVI